MLRLSLSLSLSIAVYTNKGQEIQNKFPFIKFLSLPLYIGYFP